MSFPKWCAVGGRLSADIAPLLCKKNSPDGDVPMLCEFGSRSHTKKKSSVVGGLHSNTEAWRPFFPSLEQTITPSTKWLSLNLLKPSSCKSSLCVSFSQLSRNEITQLCASENYVCICICSGRNVSSLSCYPPDSHLLPLFHLAKALFPSKVSKIQAELLTLTPIMTLVLNVCTSRSKRPSYRFEVWSWSLNGLNSLRSWRELDWPSPVSMCSLFSCGQRPGAGQGAHVPVSNQINRFRDQYLRAAQGQRRTFQHGAKSHVFATDNVKQILVTSQLLLTRY